MYAGNTRCSVNYWHCPKFPVTQYLCLEPPISSTVYHQIYLADNLVAAACMSRTQINFICKYHLCIHKSSNKTSNAVCIYHHVLFSLSLVIHLLSLLIVQGIVKCTYMPCILHLLIQTILPFNIVLREFVNCIY